jgi:hypothetical protein
MEVKMEETTEAKDERTFAVWDNDNGFGVFDARTAKDAASKAFNTDRFGTGEIFVVDTRKSLRFVKSFTATRAT